MSQGFTSDVLSASELLALLLTVDGAGSGLAADLTTQQQFTEGTEALPGIAGDGAHTDSGLKVGTSVSLVRDGELRYGIGSGHTWFDADGSTVRFSIADDGDIRLLSSAAAIRYRVNLGDHEFRDADGSTNRLVIVNDGDLTISSPAGALEATFKPTEMVLADGVDILLGSKPWTIDGSTSDAYVISQGGSPSGNRVRLNYLNSTVAGQLMSLSNTVSNQVEFAIQSTFFEIAMQNVDGGVFTQRMRFFKDKFELMARSVTEMTVSNVSFTVPNVFTDSVGGSADVLVQSGGRLRLATSSMRFKRDRRVWDADVSVLNLTPVTFKNLESETVMLGLTAEDVDELFPIAVKYDKGLPHGIDWNAIMAGHIWETARIDGELKALVERVAVLEEA